MAETAITWSSALFRSAADQLPRAVPYLGTDLRRLSQPFPPRSRSRHSHMLPKPTGRADASSRVRKKSVDYRFAANHSLYHVRNPLV
jgi:hypothetical protein